MRWWGYTACAAIVASLCLPGGAAQTAAPSAAPTASAAATSAGAGDTITFEQYREWRLNFLERRRSELAAQLSGADLPTERKARLEQAKSYYDWLAGLPEADRDRRFRERFDRIDTNHDGIMDPAERAAWREKQRAFYHHERPQRQATTQVAR